jgi:hypothetical protein
MAWTKAEALPERSRQFELPYFHPCPEHGVEQAPSGRKRGLIVEKEALGQSGIFRLKRASLRVVGKNPLSAGLQ